MQNVLTCYVITNNVRHLTEELIDTDIEQVRSHPLIEFIIKSYIGDVIIEQREYDRFLADEVNFKLVIRYHERRKFKVNAVFKFENYYDNVSLDMAYHYSVITIQKFTCSKVEYTHQIANELSMFQINEVVLRFNHLNFRVDGLIMKIPFQNYLYLDTRVNGECIIFTKDVYDICCSLLFSEKICMYSFTILIKMLME